ncbi:DUF1583 domain-containing protein [Rhodopirellula bahusiensis]|nr:DUF1583 domain-containing protein [Rhodopirellula bahusiensis]
MSACVAVLFLPSDGRSADPVKSGERVSDAASLNHLFGEGVIQENAVEFLSRIRELTPAQQYQELRQWVLPGKGHEIRVGGSIARPAGKTSDVADRHWTTLSEYPESGWIHCPAREMVALATQLNFQSELKSQIAELQPVGEQQIQAKETLSTLLAIAASDREDVLQRLTERFAKNRHWQDLNAAELWWSDLIILWAAVENPATTDLVIEELFGAFSGLRDYIPDSEFDLTADYLCLLFGYCSARTHDSLASVPDSFDVFSRVDAASHGRGSVLPRFAMHDQGVVKVSGHELDYLVYRNPLVGDYEAVAEVSTLNGAFSEIMAGGLAANPSDSRPISSVGSFAKGNWEVPVDEPIEPLSGESFVRVTSSAGKLEHFFNGRRVLVDSSRNASAPWVGIRGWRRSKGHISDLRITGQPGDPGAIDLLSDPSLRGWASYYDADENNGLGIWKAKELGDVLHLTSERTGGCLGSHDEDLLYYVRPIVWDARINYEFLCDEDSYAVHPCIGRTAFLITSSGVSLHEITDGLFQKTPLRPDNMKATAGGTTPGLVKGWNRAEVQFRGNRVAVLLNGKRIAERQIDVDESRTFGFFHFRDQTRAVVRNLHLSGDWTKSLPDLQEQSLASEMVKDLEAAAEALPEKWTHDFRNGIPEDSFIVDGRADRLSQLPDGIHMVRATPSDKTAIRLSGIVDGDFEITFGFKDLQIGDEEPTWHCGLGMTVQLDNGHRSCLDVCIRRDRLSGLPDVAFVHNTKNPGGGYKWVRGWTRRELSTSGRLRLVRRGGTIYGLFAQGDSSQFRLIGSTEIPLGPVPPLGFYNYSVGGKGMSVRGTWTDLTIRADTIDLQSAESPFTLENLNRARDEMHALDLNLTKQAMLNGEWIVADGPAESINDTSDGLLFTALGGAETAERVAILKPLQHTVAADIQAEFSIIKAVGNRESGMTTEAVIGMHLSEIGTVEFDPLHLTVTEATLITRYEPDGRIELRPRIVARNQDGKTIYQPLRSLIVESPGQLRIALRDQALHFLYQVDGSENETLVAVHKLKRKTVATKAETWFIGGLNNGEMRAVLKRMSIHTDPSTPTTDSWTAPFQAMPANAPSTANPPEDSVPSQIYNSIRNVFR